MTTKDDWSSLIDQLAETSQQSREMLSELRSELKEARRVIRELRAERDELLAKPVGERIDEAVKAGLDEYKETISTAMREAVDHVDDTFQKLANVFMTGTESGKPKDGWDLRKVARREI